MDPETTPNSPVLKFFESACFREGRGALSGPSLDAADKLVWTLDALLEDQFEVCEAFSLYLHRRHSKSAWHTLADRLLARSNGFESTKGADDFSRNYKRYRLSDWPLKVLAG